MWFAITVTTVVLTAVLVFLMGRSHRKQGHTGSMAPATWRDMVPLSVRELAVPYVCGLRRKQYRYVSFIIHPRGAR